MLIYDTIKQKIRRSKRQKEQSQSNRKSVQRDNIVFQVGHNAAVEVYWKILDIGRGPAIVLYVLELPVLQFDCFGATKGHAHCYMQLPMHNCESRLFLPEKTVEEQIERSLFEIQVNHRYWMQRHYDKGVRRATLNQQALSPVVDQSRTLLLDYHQKVLSVS